MVSPPVPAGGERAGRTVELQTAKKIFYISEEFSRIKREWQEKQEHFVKYANCISGGRE